MECDRGTMYGGLSKGVLYMNGIGRSVRQELYTRDYLQGHYK